MANREHSALELAQGAYEAYGDLADWKTFDGRDMPQWGDLPDRTRTLWATASLAVRRMVIAGKD